MHLKRHFRYLKGQFVFPILTEIHFGKYLDWGWITKRSNESQRCPKKLFSEFEISICRCVAIKVIE